MSDTSVSDHCVEPPTLNGRWQAESYDEITMNLVVVDGDPAVPLVSVRIPIQGLYIQTDTTGTPISFGDQNTLATNGAANGNILYQGNEPVFIPISDVSRVWVHQPIAGLPS